MRRYAYILLFLLILAAPFAVRLTMTRGQSARRGAGGQRLVVITPHNQDIRREFARAFSDWHAAHFGRPVEVDYRIPGGTSDIQRQLATTYNAYRDPAGRLPPDFHADIDVVWGGGDYFFNKELKQDARVLQPLNLDPKLLAEAFPKPALAGVKLYDQDKDAAGKLLPPRWVGVCLSSFGIVYNPDVYDSLGLPPPRTWNDLTDERLAGLLALADPTHSGSAGVAYLMVLQRAMADAEAAYIAALPNGPDGKPPRLNKSDPAYQQAIAQGWKRGMAQLVRMAANARYFTDSSPQVPNDVGNGEAAAGVAIDFYGRVYEETVGPRRIRFVAPPAATAITPDPVAILEGVEGEQLELATRFVEFLLTPQAQRLWQLKPGQPGGPSERSLRRTPIRTDVYADRAGWADDVSPFTEAGNFNQRGEWMGLYTDLRPLWSAAWIDARDALLDAYTRIRAVKDPARRDALLSELADLPIDMSQVAALGAERAKIPKDRVEEWKARSRLEWAERFRSHYKRVAP